MSKSFFNCEVVSAESSDVISDVAILMEKHNVGAVVVVNQQRPVGIVTDRDIALALAAHGMSPDAEVQHLMTCPVTTIGQHDGIFKATLRIRETGARRLPVVDDVGRLVGIVTADDLLLLLSRELGNVSKAIGNEVAAVVT